MFIVVRTNVSSVKIDGSFHNQYYMTFTYIWSHYYKLNTSTNFAYKCHM